MSSVQEEQSRGLASAHQQQQQQQQQQQSYQNTNAPAFPPPPTNPGYQQQNYHMTASQGMYNPASQPTAVSNQYTGYAAPDHSSQQVNYSQQQPQQSYEQPPPLPQRHENHGYVPDPYSEDQRMNTGYAPGDDPSDPVHYTRDPHKLVAYLVPFPKPQLKGIDPNTIPMRFLIYTPPPPPLHPPKEGEKEGKLHKVQRKWQDEVRAAKSSNAKVASWEGVKSRATKAIAWGVNQTTSSNLDFLGRVSDGSTGKEGKARSGSNSPTTTSRPGSPTTKKTVGVEEIRLIYPPSFALTPDQMRTEFVNTMLRTKSKAQRDSIIATGLLPVGYGIDILATLIWPFGGLGEIDTVWLYSSLRGAKTARSVTKRLNSSTSTSNTTTTADQGTAAAPGDLGKDTLHLEFTPSARTDVLAAYLAAECHKLDSAKFPTYHSPPTESQALEAIGWEPSQCAGEDRNWEDEQWEVNEVKDDLKNVVHKAAKEWRKFCIAYAKDPEKAIKK